MGSVERASADQARLPLFRALLLVQVAVAGFFGLVLYFLPGEFARATGFPGALPYIYRLAGAATLGYAVMALAGFLRPTWYRLRIPTIATFTFTLAAVAGAARSYSRGETQSVVAFAMAAGAVFAVLAGIWLVRNQGPREDDRPIEPAFRVILIVATAAAFFFGIVPLVAPGRFTRAAGFPDQDIFLWRMGAAATLGYAVAGVFELRANGRRAIRIAVIGALAFNALAAVASIVYVIEGGRSSVGYLILAASAFFTAAFWWWLRRPGT